MEIRAEALPDHWLKHNAVSLLGAALSGQGRFAAAEPLLIEGYESMEPPEQARHCKAEALARRVELYERWDRPDEATRWRTLAESSP